MAPKQTRVANGQLSCSACDDSCSRFTACQNDKRTCTTWPSQFNWPKIRIGRCIKITRRCILFDAQNSLWARRQRQLDEVNKARKARDRAKCLCVCVCCTRSLLFYIDIEHEFRDLVAYEAHERIPYVPINNNKANKFSTLQFLFYFSVLFSSIYFFFFNRRIALERKTRSERASRPHEHDQANARPG